MTPKMIPMMEKVNKADFFILGYLNWGCSAAVNGELLEYIISFPPGYEILHKFEFISEFL